MRAKPATSALGPADAHERAEPRPAHPIRDCRRAREGGAARSSRNRRRTRNLHPSPSPDLQLLPCRFATPFRAISFPSDRSNPSKSAQIFPMLFELDLIYLLHPKKTASKVLWIPKKCCVLVVAWHYCIKKNLLQTLYEVLRKICICV